jgi:hypothetical protein
MTTTFRLFAAATAAVLLAGALPRVCTAQEYPEYREYAAGPPVSAVEPEALLSEDQLDQLLGPVALYPDSLLAQVLPAATYPDDITRAAQWLAARPGASDDEIDARSWEPSVKAVAHYPTVLKMLSDNAEWAQAVGAAFLAQRQDVMDSIQRLRRLAVDAENLQSTPEQQVIVDDDAIQILPSSPEVIYVPQYDPQVVYVRRVYVERRTPLFVFVRRTIGRWLDCSFDWHSHHIMVGSGWHHGWRYEDRGWRPVDRGVVVVRTGNVVRYSGRATVAPLLTRHWSHNNFKPRPMLPPPVVVRRDDPRRDDPRMHGDVRLHGPAVIHAKPFEAPRPVVRTVETRRPTAPVGPLHVERRSDVDDAVRRAGESRSAWGRTGSRETDTGRGPVGPKVTGVGPAITHTPPPTITHTPPPMITKPPPTITRPPPAITHTPPPTITRPPPTITKPPPAITHTPPPTITRPPPTITKPPPTIDSHASRGTETGKRFVPGATAGPLPSALGDDKSARDTEAASRRGHSSLRDRDKK